VFSLKTLFENMQRSCRYANVPHYLFTNFVMSLIRGF